MKKLLIFDTFPVGHLMGTHEKGDNPINGVKSGLDEAFPLRLIYRRSLCPPFLKKPLSRKCI